MVGGNRVPLVRVVFSSPGAIVLALCFGCLGREFVSFFEAEPGSLKCLNVQRVLDLELGNVRVLSLAQSNVAAVIRYSSKQKRVNKCQEIWPSLTLYRD